MVTLLKSILTRIMIYMLHVVFTPEMTLGRVLIFIITEPKRTGFKNSGKKCAKYFTEKKIKKLNK